MLKFRNASIDDLSVIVKIYNATIPARIATADLTPVSVESKLNWFHQHNPQSRPLWIIENIDNNIIGWLSFNDFYGRPAYSGTAEISLYIDELYQNKGYGEISLNHAISQCKSLKIHTLLGFVFARNEPSLKLIKKVGFVEWANLIDVALLDEKYESLKIYGLKV